jgi:thymidylate synthase
MYQRSADTFLGLPFNIASTSLLTYIIANVTDLNPGNIIISLGDTHLYKNHVDAAKEQLLRTPYQFPKLKINKNLKNIEDIENLQFNDFELIDYKYHPTIKAKMIA